MAGRKKPHLVSLPKQKREDGWSSLITGLGTSQDKRMYSQIQWNQHSVEFYEQFYAGDELASRIVNVVPDEALRRFVEWTGVDKEVSRDVEQRCQQLDLRGAIERAWKWGRAYGGGCVYIVTDTGDPTLPLREGEKVIGLRDLSRYDLRVLTTDVEADFGSPNWGRPNIYYLSVQMGSEFKGYPIHWTRMVRFDGYLVPRRTYIRNNYWHDSILNRLHNSIMNYQIANDSAASIMQDFNVGIFKMKNLANMMAAGKESVIKRRIEMVNFSKSTIRAMLLDSDDEEFIDLSRNVTGLPELLSKQANRLVAATDIPHTKLLGESPDGSSATGNSTTSQWFDHIQSEQENYLRPKLKQLQDAIFYDIPDLDFKFKSLYQLDELQQADLRNKQALTDGVYIDKGVVDPVEIADSRFGGDTYSAETQLDKEGRESGLIAPHAGQMETQLNQGSEPGAEAPANAAKPAPGKKPVKEGTPQSLQESEPDTSGVETDKPSTQWEMRNGETAAKPKTKALVSQSMSEPMRDPKTDPKLKAPGRPNNPRVIAKAKGNGIVANKDVDKVEKTMKEFAKGSLKTSAGEKVTDPKQAAAIGYSEEKNK